MKIFTGAGVKNKEEFILFETFEIWNFWPKYLPLQNILKHIIIWDTYLSHNHTKMFLNKISYLGFLEHVLDPPLKISEVGRPEPSLEFGRYWHGPQLCWSKCDGPQVQVWKPHFCHYQWVEQQRRPSFEEMPPKHRVGMNVFSSCPNKHLFVSILQSAVQYLHSVTLENDLQDPEIWPSECPNLKHACTKSEAGV